MGQIILRQTDREAEIKTLKAERRDLKKRLERKRGATRRFLQNQISQIENDLHRNMAILEESERLSHTKIPVSIN